MSVLLMGNAVENDGQIKSAAGDIAAEISDRLNARQDVLMAMVITEEGVAASEVVSSPAVAYQ